MRTTPTSTRHWAQVNRPTYLKIKIVSLAAEARLIRQEERNWLLTAEGHRVSPAEFAKAEAARRESARGNTIGKPRWRKDSATRMGLAHHRRTVVRSEARAALLAYGFIRGRTYRSIERTTQVAPDWAKVWALIERYNAGTDSVPELRGRFEAWRREPSPVPLMKGEPQTIIGRKASAVILDEQSA